MSEDTEPAPGGGSPEKRGFAEVYVRRPVRPRRGLVPGRRVWITLASAASVVLVAALISTLTPSSGPHRAAPQAAGLSATGSATTSSGADASNSSPDSTTPSDAAATESASTSPAPAAPASSENPAPAPSQAPAAAPPPTTAQPAAPPPTTAAPAPHPSSAAVPASTSSPANPPPPPSSQATAPPSPNVPGNPLVNPASGKCLSGSAGSDGTPLILWGCNGDVNQKWDIASDGTIRTKGLCMDAAWGGVTPGTLVQIAYCSGNPAQQFVFTGSALLSRQANLCVEIVNNGGGMQLQPCNGNPNQGWQRR